MFRAWVWGHLHVENNQLIIGILCATIIKYASYEMNLIETDYQIS